MADHVALIRRAVDAVVARDIEGYQACLHDDFTIELPYAGSQGVTTKAGLVKLIGFLLHTFAEISFSIDRVHELADPNGLIIEYSSEARAFVGDIRYANRYVGIFEFRDGLISRWVEYANPVPFTEAMAALQAAAGGNAPRNNLE